MKILSTFFSRLKYWKGYNAFRPYLPKEEIIDLLQHEYEIRDLSDTDFNRQQIILKMLHKDLASDKKVSKKNIITVIKNLTVVSNCNTAAKIYFSAILPVLYYRPELNLVLLDYPVRPLIYSSCDDYNDINKWITHFLLDEEILELQIKEWFKKEIENLEKVINEVIENIRADEEGDND